MYCLYKANLAKQVARNNKEKYMVSNKVALGLFLSFSLAMGYQTIRQTNPDNIIKVPSLEIISDDNKKLVTEKDLDEMIDETIQSNPKFSNMDFKDLRSAESLLKEDWMPSNTTNDSIKVKKIQKMQKLALYISNTYDIPMKNAEKIVYTTFEESSKKNLEPMLVLSLIDSESGFKQHIKSPVGAIGLTQVMPRFHKAKIAELKKSDGTDIFSITGNIKVGTQILKEYINLAGGNLQKGLQMYNGSAGDSKKRYSSKIMSKMREYAKI